MDFMPLSESLQTLAVAGRMERRLNMVKASSPLGGRCPSTPPSRAPSYSDNKSSYCLFASLLQGLQAFNWFNVQINQLKRALAFQWVGLETEGHTNLEGMWELVSPSRKECEAVSRKVFLDLGEPVAGADCQSSPPLDPKLARKAALERANGQCEWR